jgi:hypothetical protein
VRVPIPLGSAMKRVGEEAYSLLCSHRPPFDAACFVTFVF